MASIAWIFFTISCILCGVTGTLLKPKLIRTKRWEGNGAMNGDSRNMFQGTEGVDYPYLKTIPRTRFRCSEQQFEGGFYADVETQCQVYHVCHDGRKESFLCGRGTVFNQQILSCDYWYSTECDKAPSFYYRNSQFGGSPPAGNSQYHRQSNNQGAGGYSQYDPQYNNQGAGGYSQYDPQSNNQGAGGYSQYDPQSNNQGAGYQPHDHNTSGSNRRVQDLTSGTADSGRQDNEEKNCHCLKNNYQAPWNFRSNLANQKRKK